MIQWNDDLCARHVVRYDGLNKARRERFKAVLNAKFQFDVYERHRNLRIRAFENEKRARKRLMGRFSFTRN